MDQKISQAERRARQENSLEAWREYALQLERVTGRSPKKNKIPVPEGYEYIADLGRYGGFICTNEHCKLVKECANHVTAGDFRTESGTTPEAVLFKNKWYCKKQPQKYNGAISWNKHKECYQFEEDLMWKYGY